MPSPFCDGEHAGARRRCLTAGAAAAGSWARHEALLLPLAVLLLLGPTPLHAQPSLLENLGRGVVAVRTSATEVFVGWRVLGTDPPDVAFNLYRSTGGGPPVRLNAAPLTGPTHYVDAAADLAQANAYFVRPIVFGLEQAPSASFTLPAGRARPAVPARAAAGPARRAPRRSGEAYTYSPNDTSVGDLDGDGEYELVVKWDPSNAKDNSQERLHRQRLPRRLQAGRHAALAHRPRPQHPRRRALHAVHGLRPRRRRQGRGRVQDRGRHGRRRGHRDRRSPPPTGATPPGYVLAGPEFLTVFNGQTGAALATADYVVPRGTVGDWGDNYGNRVDRFLAARRLPRRAAARAWSWPAATTRARCWRPGTGATASSRNVWTFDTGHTGTPNPYAG